MRRTFLRRLLLGFTVAAALAVSGTALAGIIRSWSVVFTGSTPFTGTAPSATQCAYQRDGTDTTGLRLSDCSSYYVCAAAASGQTLSGAGTLSAYFHDEVTPSWTRASGSDETIPAAASGNRYYCFPQRVTQVSSAGCGYWIPTGVTTSGGSAMTVFARCTK